MFSHSETDRLKAIGIPLRQRTYKESSMQGLYDVCLGRGADDFMRRRGGSIQCAFMDGYDGLKVTRYRGMTWAHAAYMAGKDRRRLEAKGRVIQAEVNNKRLTKGGPMNEYQVFLSGPRKGQPRSLVDRVVRYLVKSLGCREIKSSSRKYRQFTIKGVIGQFFFVGKNGAVRSGPKPSNSMSWTDHVHRRMEQWEAALQACVDKCNRIAMDQAFEEAEAQGKIDNLDRVIH